MKVPFAALYDYIKSTGILGQSPVEYFCEATGIARTSFFMYIRNDIRNGHASYPKRKKFDSFFKGLWTELIPLHSKNYIRETQRLIKALEVSGDIVSIGIDYSEYFEEIGEEQVPQTDTAFREFIGKSRFRDFIWMYLSLADNEEYMNYIPGQLVINDPGPIHLIEKDHYANYMVQSLIDRETKETVLSVDLNKDLCDFGFFRNNRLSVIAARGGQGKSLFLYVLRRIHYDSREKLFDDVILIPLVDLTLFSLSADNADSNWIEGYIRKNYPSVDIRDESKKFLILLDGFNEYRVAKDAKTVTIISKAVEKLIYDVRQTNRLSVVMTTREPESVTSLLRDLSDIRIYDLSGTAEAKSRQIMDDFGDNPIKNSLSEYIDTPLYALMFDELSSDEKAEIRDKYSLMDMVYTVRAKQRLGANSRDAYEQTHYLFFYFILLPYLAYWVMTTDTANSYFFDRNSISSALAHLEESTWDERLYALCKSKKLFPQLDDTSLSRESAEVWMQHLKQEENRIINRLGYLGKFSFTHQEWRNYLAAKHMHMRAELLKDNYQYIEPKDVSAWVTDFNVDSEIGSMVLQSFGMNSGKEANDQAAAEFFAIRQNDMKFHASGSILFLHLAFAFSEYLKMELTLGENGENQPLFLILFPLFDYLSRIQTNDEIIKQQPELTDRLCDCFSKIAEYYRRMTEYRQAWAVIKLAQKYNSDSDIILQAEAKVYLACFMSLIQSKEPQETLLDFPEDLIELSPEELFEIGKEKLKALSDKGYHLSGNLWALLKSKPAPVIIHNMSTLEEDKEGFKPDHCAALLCGIKIICRFSRRDIAYTVREAVNLLLKSYVRVSDNCVFSTAGKSIDPDSLDLEICDPLLSQPLNNNTLRLAKWLLSRADGQELAGLNYQRGLVYLMSGQREDAERYFKRRFENESTLMSDIRLKFDCGADTADGISIDQKIRDGYDLLIKSIRANGDGVYDKIHPAYFYLEARELQKSLSGQISRELRKKTEKEFSLLEQSENITETVNTIYSFITNT